MSAKVRAFVLAVWSVFLAWLWATGEVSRYLGPRTYWVVPFGAVTLGLAALAAGRPGARRAGAPLRREVVGAVVLVVPILAVAAVPRAKLGSLAASNKSTSGILTGASSAVAAGSGGEVSFRDIHYASQSEGYAATRGIAAGFEVELTGFVTAAPDAPPATFELTRFYVSCCAADAIPYSVTVEGPPGTYREDQWLRVKGALVSSDDGFLVDPDEIQVVAPPTNPYLY